LANRAKIGQAVKHGAVIGSERKVTLKIDTKLDRYGSLGKNGVGGRYITARGTSIEKLALPLENTGKLTNLKVVKNFKAIKGIVAPHPIWGLGGGIQYYLYKSVEDLIELGFLIII
jgi:hypothetical protein